MAVGCGRIGFAPLTDDSVVDGQLAQGLVGYWAFEEGGGAVTEDLSGHGNDGFLMGNAAWATGRVGGAVLLDGNSFVRIGDVAILDFAGSFSVATWVREDATLTDYDHGWFKGGSSTFYRGYDMELGANGWTAHLNDSVNNVAIGLGPTVLGSWVHLAIVVDRNARMAHGYVDGVEAVGSPVPLGAIGDLTTTVPASIGARDNGGSGVEFFIGAMDEVRVYDRPLRAEEIAVLAQ